MPPVRQKLFWLFDIATLALAYFVGAWLVRVIYLKLPRGALTSLVWPPYAAALYTRDSMYLPHQSFKAFFLVFPLILIGLEVFGGHRPIRDQHVARILAFGIAIPILSLLAEILLLLASRTEDFNPIVVFTMASSGCAAICLTRFVGRAWFCYSRKSGMYAEDIAIIARPEIALLAADRLLQSKSAQEYNLAGYFSLVVNSEPILASNGAAVCPLGKLQDIEQILVNVAVHRLIVILPESDDHRWLAAVLRTCDYFRLTVELIPEAVLKGSFLDLKVTGVGHPLAIPSLELAPSDSSSDWLYVKRVFDVSVSATLLVLLTPAFLLIAAAIKASTPHLPVFYSLQVVGSRGRRFTGYKFTTMVADANLTREQLALMNEMNGPVFKMANDPRVTPLGKFLRKYSLNEFPQLWSVLKGDMSLVGPRPAFPSELRRYELWQKRKLSAQPGITCFWQVRGRNRISNFDEWVQMDLEYIRKRSLWIDCQILVRTAWVVVRGSGC